MNSANRSAPVSLAVFLLRLIWGALFLFHGVLKFTDMSKAVESFARIGIPHPTITAPAIALLEVVGGVVLILGLSWITRLLALLLAADMVGAIVKVRLHSSVSEGYELNVVLLAGLVAIALIGPGMFAIMRERSYTSREVVPAAP
ncbi:MAG TPA: DoxX family protein [Ktedonobacteraceae bacterium]|nr:DoxX family protein [Ktedonobacteraceae bacterium]